VPPHRRIDPRRGKIATRVNRGDLSLILTIEAGRGAAVVRSAFALVNDLFQLMHECYPDYLAAQFGLIDE
jgi:hypothetical protein